MPLDRPSPAARDTAFAILRQRLGERLQTGQAIREQHRHTTTWIANEPPDAVAFAETTEEVAEIVRTCAAHGVPIIPFGTGTSLEGHVNAPLGGLSLDLSRMDRVRAIHAEDLTCDVEPGITRKRLNEELRATGLMFPIDPGADASIGGMTATRASGTNAVRYGTMKDVVLALEVVLASGEVIRTARRARKSSAGYDLTRLMVGSEGTLGVITGITLRLSGIPEAMSSARATFETIEGACRTVIETIQMGVPVARMELLDAASVRAVNAYSGLDLPEAPMLLMEFHGSAAGVAEQAETVGAIAAENGGSGFAWTTTPEERTRLWQARHDAYWSYLALRPGAKALATDVCVPISRLAEAVTRAEAKAKELGLLAPIIGHVGDGNFHVSPIIDMADAREVAAAKELTAWLASLALELDGTCTGEHGIGQGKRDYLRAELGGAVDEMAAIKAALDPQGILNPGKIF